MTVTVDREEHRRRRRDVRRRALFDTTIPSPCISICQMEEATGFCLGCRRTLDEIRDWIIMTPEEKREVLARVAERKARLAASSSSPAA